MLIPSPWDKEPGNMLCICGYPRSSQNNLFCFAKLGELQYVANSHKARIRRSIDCVMLHSRGLPCLEDLLIIRGQYPHLITSPLMACATSISIIDCTILFFILFCASSAFTHQNFYRVRRGLDLRCIENTFSRYGCCNSIHTCRLKPQGACVLQ